MATTAIAHNQFLETELNVSAKRTETLFRILFMVMAGLLILPVLDPGRDPQHGAGATRLRRVYFHAHG